ncbi:uncharacterized protein LOC123705153 isoform X2 [Colias croceus]|uniref:uncharacterized protein LOC123705153 isoform X2 n=1 Tax=Colias crocea TaxID=72248 RepID=UPI001E27B0E9|nr:uncharacterized protein LOC123705153 isoform X2 [Colias croceus]
MGDGLKITKDKRHRSSSSIAGGPLDGTRSERKLDLRASIPEVDDQFALAEARCDELQEKIDLVKGLKRRRKLKKRSMTHFTEQAMPVENVPFISVRTQPKKTLMVTEVSQQAARLRRLETPANPTRGYLDPATLEQHQMVGQVRGYNQMFWQPNKQSNAARKSPKPRDRRGHPEGDAMYRLDYSTNVKAEPHEVACGDDDVVGDYSDDNVNNQQYNDFYLGSVTMNKKQHDGKSQSKQTGNRRRHVPKEASIKEAPPHWMYGVIDHSQEVNRAPGYGKYKQQNSKEMQSTGTGVNQSEERPVVELFNKSRSSPSADSGQRQAYQRISSPDARSKKVRDTQAYVDDGTIPHSDATATPVETVKKPKEHRHPRRVKYRSRHYELPTVASQMKQAGMRCYYGNANRTNIPFIVSKSTAPSHNIGVNIQQVLNGLKIQQPLSGIPLTIAHHMGLGHIPTYGTKSATVTPSLDNREINAIRVGRRLLRLPSYKYMSYNRLLSMYREGDGMVPKFLRAISRPHYFYTSMYNLTMNRDDFDNATSKGQGGCQEAKQSLAEYASLYREYEQVEKCLNENYDPELERRKEDLSRQLAAREEHIRKVVQDFRNSTEGDMPLRASASNAEDGYRHSSYKINQDGSHQ